jgi:LPS sulfotransferase NodH
VPSDRPIFVVGAPRSGTTMLQLMLHAHPRIAIPPETRFVLGAYQRRAEWGDLTDIANRRRLAEWITRGETNFADLDLDADAVIAQIVDGPPVLGAAMGIVFRAYANKFGKPRWGDKRPAYLLNVDLLLRMFPNAQIINIIRDGRDCVASTIGQPWHRGGLNEAIYTWCRSDDEGWRARRTLDSETYHELHYESLVADPVRRMKAICAFLGEDFVPAMASPATMADVAVPERKVWHELTRGEVTTTRVGTFADRLRPAELAFCQSVMAKRLVRRGYQLVDASQPSLGRHIGYLPKRGRAAVSRTKRAVTWREIARTPPAVGHTVARLAAQHGR